MTGAAPAPDNSDMVAGNATAGAGRDRWLGRAIIIFAMLNALRFIIVDLGYYARGGSYAPDFAVFWTAARFAFQQPEILYDPAQITALQGPIIAKITALRPFVYPPTSLILFGPFGRLTYPVAAAAWAGLSFLMFFHAARQMVPTRHVIAALCTPPLVFALWTLQVTPMLGAGTMLGIMLLDRRPGLAGAVIALVALVKPQAVLLFPLAALAMRCPVALAGFATTGLTGMLLCHAINPQLWWDWLDSIAGFPAIAIELGLMKRSITPNGIAYYLGLPHTPAVILQCLGIALGGTICWRAFRHDDDVTRLVGLSAGSLLCSPYAMYYELATLAPAMVMFAASARRGHRLAALPMIGIFAMFTLPLMALVVWRPPLSTHRLAARRPVARTEAKGTRDAEDA